MRSRKNVSFEQEVFTLNVKLKRSLSIFLSVCLFLVSVTVAFVQGDYDGKIQSAGKGGEKAGVIVVDEKTKTIEDNYLISIDENTPCDSSVKTLADGYIEKIKKEYAKVMFLSAKVMLTLYPILLIIKQII